LQGRCDPPLDPLALPEWRLPPELAGFRWLSSPLRRAVQTAALLGVTDIAIEPRLTEMDWGEWEGSTLDELREQFGGAFAENEARGLDFRPPGGESPRDVQVRLLPLFAELAAAGRTTAALTHKGVIRAAFALASGWDMRGKPPVRLAWSAAHVFKIDAIGRLSVARLNIGLERA
jgi:probable phosphoglycerate mutase